MTFIPPSGWRGACLHNCAARVRSPHTDPQVLLEILTYATHYKLTESDLAALASNPALPYAGLKQMLEDYPAEVLRNPAFRLALATDMGLLNELGPRVRAAIAGCPETAPGLIRLLGAKRTCPVENRIAAAGNPACPEDMLWKYPIHARPVRESLAGNPSLPEGLIVALTQDISHEVRASIAARTDLSEALIHQIATDHDWHVRQVLARNPKLPLSLQIHLSHDAYYKVRANLATRPDLPASLLTKMAQREKGMTVLRAIMKNPRTPKSTLLQIAQGRNPDFAQYAQQCLEAR